jgi:hypothetical protein
MKNKTKQNTCTYIIYAPDQCFIFMHLCVMFIRLYVFYLLFVICYFVKFNLCLYINLFWKKFLCDIFIITIYQVNCTTTLCHGCFSVCFHASIWIFLFLTVSLAFYTIRLDLTWWTKIAALCFQSEISWLLLRSSDFLYIYLAFVICQILFFYFYNWVSIF